MKRDSHYKKLKISKKIKKALTFEEKSCYHNGHYALAYYNANIELYSNPNRSDKKRKK